MADDLERLIRERRPELDAGPEAERELRRRLGLRGAPTLRTWRRGGLLAVAVALLTSGAIAASQGWTPADLPPFGSGQDAFVLPTEDSLPDGTPRTRPPKIEEIPERPAILFPAGVSYRDALYAYGQARRARKVLPPGAELVDPLPAGKSLHIRSDGRVALDPAAPSGFDPDSGVVFSAGWWLPEGFPPPQIPRCQMVVEGASAVPGSNCDAFDDSASVAWVREGADGRWLPSRQDGRQAALRGSDRLSVFEREALPSDRPTKRVQRVLDRIAKLRADSGGLVPASFDRVRRVDVEEHEMWLLASGEDEICLLDFSPFAGWACGERRTLALEGYYGGGGPRVAPDGSQAGFEFTGIVGDGTERVEFADGQTAGVVDNVFSYRSPKPTTLVALVGASGRLLVEGADESGIALTPGASNVGKADLSQASEILGIRLVGGERVAWMSAPLKSGTPGRCTWLGHERGRRLINCPESSWQPAVDEIAPHWHRLGPPGRRSAVLTVRAASEVGSVKVELKDGSVISAQVREGRALLEITAEQIRNGRGPSEIVTIDRGGVPLQSRPEELGSDWGRG